MHRVEWTEAKIREFWGNIDQLIVQKEHVNDYFSNMMGDDFLEYVDRSIRFEDKRVLDYGCGMGILMEKILLKYKPEIVCGCDISDESVVLVNDRCGKYQNFGSAYDVEKAKEEFGKGSFDIVIAMEVVEHLSDKDLLIMLKNIRYFLKKGGLLIISTPNDEDLTENIVVCPDCGCYFHKVQHIRSWNKDSLSDYMKKYGFKKRKTILTDLINRRSMVRRIYSKIHLLRKKIFHGKFANLIYIGQKM